MAKYKYRLGYTEGFNDALENKPNSHFMSESEWIPREQTDPNFKYNQTELEKTGCYSGLDEMVSKMDTYGIGYNWGYKHGMEERQRIRSLINDDTFERKTIDLANSFKILFLEIKAEVYLFAWRLDPDSEKSSRVKFIDEFISGQEDIHPEKKILNDIALFLSEKKLQRAIDTSISYFRQQKDLTNFAESMRFGSILRNLRLKAKLDNLSKEESENEKKQITESIAGIINKELLSLK